MAVLQAGDGRQTVLIEIEKVHGREVLHVETIQSVFGEPEGT
jgi:hypothetical protein